MKQYAILLSIDKPRLKEDGIEKRELYDSINDAMAKIGFYPQGRTNLYLSRQSSDRNNAFTTNPVEMILEGQEMIAESHWAFEYCKSIQLLLVDRLGDLKRFAQNVGREQVW